MDGTAITDRVLARGAVVKGTRQTAPRPNQHQGLLAFLSAIAQDERERIAKRAGEGRNAAKAAGRRWGRKPERVVIWCEQFSVLISPADLSAKR